MISRSGRWPSRSSATPRPSDSGLYSQIALFLAGATAVSVGLAIFTSLTRPEAPSAIFILLAIGAAVVAGVLLLVRPTPAPPNGPPVDGGLVPALASGRVDSAFVCAKCASYTPAPDWESLFREFEASKDLEGRGSAKPVVTPAASPVDAIWPRWQPGVAVAALPEDRPTRLPMAYVPGAWSTALAPHEQEPGLIFSEAELGPIPLAASGIGISGGRSTDAVPRIPVAAILPALGTEESIHPLGSSVGPYRSRDEPESVVSAYAPLYRWISQEVEGLVASSRGSVSDRLDPRHGEPNGAERRPVGSPTSRPCATCHRLLDDPSRSARCSGCHRPICEPCRGSAVAHRGEIYCSPCARNRMGSDLLRTIEDPIPVGGSDRSGGSRPPRTRSRNVAVRGGSRPRRTPRPKRPPRAKAAAPPPSPEPTPGPTGSTKADPAAGAELPSVGQPQGESRRALSGHPTRGPQP